MLDNLYEKPVPILDLDIPAVATSSSLRGLMFHSLYTVGNWGTLAERLSEGLRGDFTGIVAATLSRVDPAQVLAPDSSAYTNPPIMVSPSLRPPKRRSSVIAVRRCRAVLKGARPPYKC